MLGGFKAQLAIDDVTRDLEVDQIVTFEGEDRSVRSGYGSTLKFKAWRIVGERSAEEARQAAWARREAEKWLRYARDDAEQGLTYSNALAKAGQMAAPYAELHEEIFAIKELVKANRVTAPLREAGRWLGLAIGDARCGRSRTNAIRQALEDAPAFPELADDLAVLRDLLAAQQAAEAAEARVVPSRTVVVDAPPLGVPVRFNGRPIVVTQVVRPVRIGEEDASLYGGHLLGYEGDRGVLVEYRPATDPEVATLAEREAAAVQLRRELAARAARIRQIADHIQTAGERPVPAADGLIRVDGDLLLGGPDVYGGGAWFVVDPGSGIWYIRNNGMDGDDWSANNIGTGGAGAIGWRVGFDQQLADELRQLHHDDQHHEDGAG